MAGEVIERPSRKRGGGARRKKRRIPIRIDMTPMVDIAFLLLIFYMVSTVFAMPQAIEINLPPPDTVGVQKLLTIRVDSLERTWWNLGLAKESNLPRYLPPGGDTLRGLLVAENRLEPRLNTLLLIHPAATYNVWVDILDEIGLVERSWNVWTAKQMGIPVEQLPDSRKYSYRYALGDWDNIQSKLIAAADSAARERGDLR